MDWLRWHHGTVNNPKWRVVARKSNQRLGDVIAIWAALCERASKSDERGSIAGWKADELAAAIDIDPDDVREIVLAMQDEKRAIDGDVLIGWSKYNPKRERDENETSTDRVRNHRAKKRLDNDDVVVTADETPCNAINADETPRNAQIRGEEIREDSEESLRASSCAPRLDDSQSLANEIWGMAGIKPEAFRAAGKSNDVDAVSGWLSGGATPDEIRTACKTKIATGKDIKSLWRYLNQTVPEAIDTVRAAASAAPPKLRDTADREKWRLTVKGFTERNFWPEIKGPKPGKHGCMCPPDILAEFNLKEPA